jgi:HEAT repeat protein
VLRFRSFLLLVVCHLVVDSVLLHADDEPAKPTADSPFLKATAEWHQLRERLTRVKDGAKAIEGAPTEKAPFVVPRSTHWGIQFSADPPKRFLAVELTVVNPSDVPVTLREDDVALTVGGNATPFAKPSSDVLLQPIPQGTAMVTLSEVKRLETLTVPAKNADSVWIIAEELPDSAVIPDLRVAVKLADETIRLDLRKIEEARLDLDTRILGPRNTIGVLTIRGQLNSINSQALSDVIAELVEKKATRLVLQWDKTAEAPEPRLKAWLELAAQREATEEGETQAFPLLPINFDELKLVKMPASTPDDENGRDPNTYPSLAEALAAATKTLFPAMSKSEIAAALKDAHPALRAAAIRFGAPRLDASIEPAILAAARDPDREIRLAAIAALAEFPSEESSQALLEFVRDDNGEFGAAATRGLATSRYVAHQERLRQFLRQTDRERRQRILRVLAESPRPEWSSELFAAAQDEQGRWNLDALKGVVNLGHEQVVDLLERALSADQSVVKDYSFQILARRPDARSESLALAELLRRLESRTPDNTMQELIQRTRDPRTLPALLKHLDAGRDRSAVIAALGAVGETATGDRLVSQFDKFQPHEKAAALHALKSLRHPELLKLAGSVLQTNDASLLSSGSQLLVQEGSSAACERIVDGLKLHLGKGRERGDYALSVLCNALASFSDPLAIETLKELQASKDNTVRRMGRDALNQVRARSPAFQYVYQAQEHAESEDWVEADTLYTFAIELDPELPQGWSGRGNVRLRQNRFPDAGKDFEAAMRLDPDSTMGITGLALVWVMTGREEEGLALIAKRRADFADDALYLYNSACVYGRALENLRARPASAEQDKRKQELRKLALRDLEASMRNGFDDVDWMLKDPDLKSLQADEEFLKLIRVPRPPKG